MGWQTVASSESSTMGTDWVTVMDGMETVLSRLSTCLDSGYACNLAGQGHGFRTREQKSNDKVQSPVLVPGSLASVVERMAESRGWTAFVWRGVYVRRARGVGVQMLVAYWRPESELLGSGSDGEMGQDASKQVEAIRPDERSGEQQKGKVKQAHPKSKTDPRARADGYYYERTI